MSPDTTEPSHSRRRLTRIVATLGPASNSESMIETLIENGVNIFRLNFSHGDHESHGSAFEQIKSIAARRRETIAILQDIPGPKLRIGDLENSTALLREGAEFRLDTSVEKGNSETVPFDSDGWHEAVRPGDRVLLGDGNLQLEAVSSDNTGIDTVVRAGGELRSRQGLNFPETDLELGAVTESDWKHIEFGLSLGVDAIALSFVQGPEDLIAVRRYVQRRDTGPLLIAKIETPLAVKRIDSILEQSDGIMVARGDLGISLPIERIPVIQKRLINLARNRRKFVITATQMLESMTHALRPTRAEATDVANAVYDATDAVMLSGETAIGDHPDRVVKIMCRILEVTEPEVKYAPEAVRDHTVDEIITVAVRQVATDLDVRAVLAPISSGSTAIRMSNQRMDVPIFVGTTSGSTARRLVFYQGVFPLPVDPDGELKRNTELLIEHAKERGWLKDGYRVLLTGGMPFEKAGTTNFLRALTVGEEI